jgi:hypothetical protein
MYTADIKTCSRCKEYKPFEYFPKTKTNKDGYSYLCKICNKSSNREYRLRNSEKYYANQKKVRSELKGFMSQLLHGAKTRASKKGFDFDIDAEFLTEMLTDSGYKCAVTGIEMNLFSSGRKKANPFKCSLDRIDSSKGYTKDNVRFVCWAVNQMKADRTDEEFKFWIDTLYMAISSQANEQSLEGSTTRVHHPVKEDETRTLK